MKYTPLFFRASLSLTSLLLSLQAPAVFAEDMSKEPQKKDIGVVGKDEKDICPTKIKQGEIIGITHAVHEGVLGPSRTPYRRPYTVFSIALGKQIFTTNYPGIVHKKDFVGAVTVSECRQPTVAVIPVGALKSDL